MEVLLDLLFVSAGDVLNNGPARAEIPLQMAYGCCLFQSRVISHPPKLLGKDHRRQAAQLLVESGCR